MKKLGLFLACLVVIFATSGCGNKSLVCTSEDEESKTEMTLNFDSKDEFKDGKVVVSAELSEEITDEEIEAAESFYKEYFGEDNVKVTTKNNVLSISITISKDNLEDFNIGTEDTSYDAILKSIQEEENVTCKSK